jgi:hypothetical protein
MPRKSNFAAGTASKNNVSYSYTDLGDAVDVTATTVPENENEDLVQSFGLFHYDPVAGQHVPVPGTLDLHPDHAAIGVGQEMRRLAQKVSDMPRK